MQKIMRKAAISKIQQEFREAESRTSSNSKICMTLALNYSGRADITRVARDLAKRVASDELGLTDISEQAISDCLYSSGTPDPDLLIRTSGELRLSNFLLWELAYSELYFTDIHWPEFRKRHLFEAIYDFQQRNRRFGGN